MKLAPARLKSTLHRYSVDFAPRNGPNCVACTDCEVAMAEVWKPRATDLRPGLAGHWFWTTRGELSGTAPTRAQAVRDATQAAYRDGPVCDCHEAPSRPFEGRNTGRVTMSMRRDGRVGVEAV